MRNITVKQYAYLQDKGDYDIILKHLKPKNLFCGKTTNIERMKYNEVIVCYKTIENLSSFDDLYYIFNLCYKVEKEEFWNEKVVNLFASQNYLLEEFKAARERESRLLKSLETNERKWLAAGGARMQQFSYISPLDDLGQRYGIYPFELGKKKYGDIIYLLTLTKTKDEVAHKYSTME